MTERDHFQSVRAESRQTLKVQRSEFIAIAFPASVEEHLSERLAAAGKEFYDANHRCWAYRFFAGGAIQVHSSDAGEPSGTAGRPILSAIESVDLLDTAVIVVRYFGGVKLGTGGLARAYRDSADAVLAGAARQNHYLYRRLVVETGFASMNQIYRLVSPPDVVLVAEHFGDTNRFELDVRSSMVAAIQQTLTEKQIHCTIE